jgi:hypothetical protein
MKDELQVDEPTNDNSVSTLVGATVEVPEAEEIKCNGSLKVCVYPKGSKRDVRIPLDIEVADGLQKEAIQQGVSRVFLLRNIIREGWKKILEGNQSHLRLHSDASGESNDQKIIESEKVELNELS